MLHDPNARHDVAPPVRRVSGLSKSELSPRSRNVQLENVSTKLPFTPICGPTGRGGLDIMRQ